MKTHNLTTQTRDVLVAGDPILLQTAEPVAQSSFGSRELDTQIATLLSTMKKYNGAGLAAPQVGWSQRILVYGVLENPRYPDIKPIPDTVLINPKIIDESAETSTYYEGCLSIPHLRGLVPRATAITYVAYLPNGKRVVRDAYDFEARVILHEIDHLNGYLFLSRMENSNLIKYTQH